MTDLVLPSWLCALPWLRAVPIDAERCPTCGGNGSLVRMDPIVGRVSCDTCSGLGLVAPQPGQWTLRAGDEPCQTCKGRRKVYPEHLRCGVALDVVPGYDPRVPCPTCPDFPAPGEEVGPVTVTAVVPIVRASDGPTEHKRFLFIADGGDEPILMLAAVVGDEVKAEVLSDHLLPGLDWSRPYAALLE